MTATLPQLVTTPAEALAAQVPDNWQTLTIDLHETQPVNVATYKNTVTEQYIERSYSLKVDDGLVFHQLSYHLLVNTLSILLEGAPNKGYWWTPLCASLKTLNTCLPNARKQLTIHNLISHVELEP